MQDTVRTVLVVEDEDGVRNLIRTLLRLAGYDVLSCQDGPEAIDLLNARGGNIHLVVTDINLGPIMDGVELAENLRSLFPAIKVLYISGRDEEERLAREIATGQAWFLMKPFTPRALAEQVKSILAGVAAAAPSR
jgi:CheY-like chemotaxis protein